MKKIIAVALVASMMFAPSASAQSEEYMAFASEMCEHGKQFESALDQMAKDFLGKLGFTGDKYNYLRETLFAKLLPKYKVELAKASEANMSIEQTREFMTMQKDPEVIAATQHMTSAFASIFQLMAQQDTSKPIELNSKIGKKYETSARQYLKVSGIEEEIKENANSSIEQFNSKIQDITDEALKKKVIDKFTETYNYIKDNLGTTFVNTIYGTVTQHDLDVMNQKAKTPAWQNYLTAQRQCSKSFKEMLPTILEELSKVLGSQQ